MTTSKFARASFLAAAVAVAVAFSGCVGTLTVNPEWVVAGPERGDEAIALIEARLGGTEWLPVVWYGAAALASCPGSDEGYRSDQDFESPTGCTSGITGDNVSIVGWEGTNTPAWTAVAHELVHQRHGDMDHENPALWGDRGRDNFVAGTVLGDISLELLSLGM